MGRTNTFITPAFAVAAAAAITVDITKPETEITPFLGNYIYAL